MLEQEVERTCLYCDGQGCEECDYLGHRTAYVLRDGDAFVRISGSRHLTTTALEAMARAGLDAIRPDAMQG